MPRPILRRDDRDATTEKQLARLTNKLRQAEETIQYLGSLVVRLQQAHDTDDRTGLLTYEAFVRDAARVARRMVEPMVIFADGDRFKHINDTYGHDIGDLVLVKIADMLRDTYGPDALIARTNTAGDEFGVLVDKSIADQVTGLSVTVEDVPYPITLSVGMARLDTDLSTAMARADVAMYSVKKGTPGRVVAWNPEQHRDPEINARPERRLRDRNKAPSEFHRLLSSIDASGALL